MNFDKCKKKEGLEKTVCEVKIIAKDKEVRKGVAKVVLAGIVIANPYLAPIQAVLNWKKLFY